VGGVGHEQGMKEILMQIIYPEDRPLIPWKNGGGLTREIAVHYDEAQYQDFLWRLSQAIIDAPCTFSRFDGIDRSIAVLDGAGVLLKSATNPVTLGLTKEAFSFRGEEDITATPVKGITTVLNIMTRRGFFSHQMEYCPFAKEMTFEASADVTFIVAKNEATINGQKIAHLACATGFEKGEEIELKAPGKGEVFIISLFAC